MSADRELGPPPGACDCHVHVFDPARFPYSPKRGYTPPPATVSQLLELQAALGLDRVVLVQPSVYGVDNGCMADALAALGARARGVAVIDDSVPDSALDALHRAGVRGVRLNFDSEGVFDPDLSWRRIGRLMSRIHPLGWHLQINTSLGVVAALADRLADAPLTIVLDHFAGARADAGPGAPGFRELLRLMRSPRVYLKVSAAYRVSERPDQSDVAALARPLIEAAPDRILWGSDWPHPGPRVPGHGPNDVDPPHAVDDARLLGLLAAWARDPATFRAILVDNPARLYGFSTDLG